MKTLKIPNKASYGSARFGLVRSGVGAVRYGLLRQGAVWIVVLILFSTTFCFAQTNEVYNAIGKRANIQLFTNDSLSRLAKYNAQLLILSYSDDDPSELQKTVDNLKDEWYSDVDIFLGDDLDGVMAYIKTCDNAYFLEHTGKVVIDVSETQKICMVTIYCLP